ncbi:chemotaxis protein CheX [Geotalea toluenoxydans]|uniref:chemotaxis protein CheX n=1 Tax=Geotalea toluenoxydans TaxID=421624 RepID=UPI0006CF9F2F|nr:chemotaxis protein CheX [Geotalea toluenoxydans]
MTLNSAVSKAVNMQEEDLAGYVIHATKEVFNTMVMLDLEDSYPLREPVTTFHCSVTGMVGLAGTYTGILSIHCPKAFALRITSNMLGMDVADVGEDVNDALGEIANMLGGYVKQILSKGGLDINLSIPTVISGEEYTVNSMSDDNCVIIPFTNEGERFLVALKLRKEG